MSEKEIKKEELDFGEIEPLKPIECDSLSEPNEDTPQIWFCEEKFQSIHENRLESFCRRCGKGKLNY